MDDDIARPAADVGRRVRELRVDRGLSLSELARRAGIGKGSLSEIEAGRRNPTIETLYALCGPMSVPMTALVGDEPAPPGHHPRTRGGGMTSVTLDVRHLADHTVEVFRLEFEPGADHTSPAHGPGVVEHLTVVAGTVSAGPTGRLTTVPAGSSTSFRSDSTHRYRAGDDPAEAVLVILTPADAEPPPPGMAR
ncbi:helix-turn-helix domain-containing protein [Williamsia deligens]|uniref:Helix-turn-helix domain-containing protein n=1 Tax=Williamsia deligens TaxID=321325 RepID=A0ABW3G8I9_9NOCA|nr:XRE family transcriptional regulator [Williamsia deligens]MCP2193285.1 helix-turn-helix protein [Williamsia deligens]